MTDVVVRYKFRGPETWAAIREAYVAGDTAHALAQRYDVTIGAIRQRARRQGWTRRRLAAAQEAPLARRAATGAASEASSTAETLRVDPVPLVLTGPPPEPEAALDAALRTSVALMAAGRHGEAAAALKTGEAMLALIQAARRARPKTMDEVLAMKGELWERLTGLAEELALAALTDPSSLRWGELRDWAQDWAARNAERLAPAGEGDAEEAEEAEEEEEGGDV